MSIHKVYYWKVIKLILTEFLIKILTSDYLVIKRVIKKEVKYPRTVSVLDLGSGTGNLSRNFNKSKYLGVDIDAGSVSLAARKFPDYTYLKGDITKFRNGKKYDLVFISGVLHHLTDSGVRKASKTISQHLAGGGKAVIIEAVPPVNKWNLVGSLLRRLDNGSYIREIGKYINLLEGNLSIQKYYRQQGGLVDYGIIIAGKKKSG